MGAGIEPAGEIFRAGERGGLAREVGKNGLGDVADEVVIAIDLPERGGIDKVDVTLDHFPEGIAGISLGKLAQQFMVGCHFHFNI